MKNNINKKIPLTIIIPVKNEEKNLVRCLQRVKAFSQVVLIDSGSTDSTPEIAKTANVEIVEFSWNGSFPKKRNWALCNIKIENDWVLFLDADEYLTDEFINEIKFTLPESKVNGYWVNYSNYFMGKRMNFGDPMRKLALFRFGKGEYEKIPETSWTNLDMEVHEHLIVSGDVGSLRSSIDHHDYKGYEAYVNRHNAYSTWEALRYSELTKQSSNEILNFRQKIKYLLINSWMLGPLYFIYSYFFRLGFLDGKAGLILSINKAIYFFQIKIKINELNALS